MKNELTITSNSNVEVNFIKRKTEVAHMMAYKCISHKRRNKRGEVKTKVMKLF